MYARISAMAVEVVLAAGPAHLNGFDLLRVCLRLGASE
jgi:hypothetical protein